MRDGREARPFFDPKRGQLGANFSGGTGLTRPPGILRGAHTPLPDPRFRREDRVRRVGTVVVAAGASPASPRRRCIAPGCRDGTPSD